MATPDIMIGAYSAVLLVTLRQSSFENEDKTLCSRDNVLAEHRLHFDELGY